MIRNIFFFLIPALAMAGELKVTSYNIRLDARSDTGFRNWPERSTGVVAFLKEGEFSVIGLQEVLHNQLVDVQKGLPKFKQIGVGRDDGKKAGEYSAIFYDPAIWTADAKEQGTFWLSDTPEIAGSKSWGNNVVRICTWARLTGKDGKGLYVFNTHFDHQSQPSREKAAELILKRVKSRKHGKEPVILMGDFNATTSNPAIVTFLKSDQFIDHAEGEQKLTYNFWKTGLKEGLRIDHIFTSPSIKEAEFKVLSDGDPPHSDHHPVVLTIPTG